MTEVPINELDAVVKDPGTFFAEEAALEIWSREAAERPPPE